MALVRELKLARLLRRHLLVKGEMELARIRLVMRTRSV